MDSLEFIKNLKDETFDSLKEIASLEFNVYEDLIEYISKFKSLAIRPDLVEFSEKMNKSIEKVDDIIYTTIFLSINVEENFNAEDLFKYVKDKDKLPEKDIESLRKYLKFAFSSLSKKFSAIARKSELLRKYFPILRNFRSTSSLSPLFEKKSFRGVSNVEKYEPKVLDAEPISIIYLTIRKNEEDKTVNFAINEDEIDELITSLKLAKKEIKALSNYLTK
jgi:hypothetical protein